MPGTYIFRPIEANLSHDTDWLGNMDPYCAYMINNRRVKGEICKNGGMHPFWNETTSVPIEVDQPACVVELMDKDKILPDDSIGTFVIDLNEVKNKGLVNRWYPIYHKNKPAGEILFETTYQPEPEPMPVIVETPLITESKPVIQETIVTEKVITEKEVMAPTKTISEETSRSETIPLSKGTTTTHHETSNLGSNQSQQGSHTVYHSTITSKDLPHSGKGCVEDPLYGKTVGVQNIEHVGGIPYNFSQISGHQQGHSGQHTGLSQPSGQQSGFSQRLGQQSDLSQPLGQSNLNQPSGSQINRPFQGDVNQPLRSNLNMKSGQGNLGSQGGLSQGNLGSQGGLNQGILGSQGGLNQGNLGSQGGLNQGNLGSQGGLGQGNLTSQGGLNQGNLTNQGDVNRKNLPL